MSGNNFYYGQISYSPLWLIISLGLFIIVFAIIYVIFRVTRRRNIKTLGSLKIQAPKVVNMNVLRNKYVKLINQTEERFIRRQIKASVAHQQLSLLVRLFYYEGMGFHADIMTLSDLKKSNYKRLEKLVDQYYPAEFDKLENGAVSQSAQRAREIVREE